MSQKLTVTIYGVEAELPPGEHLLGVGLATAKPLMLGCNDGKGQQVFCFNQWWVEVFAATALCRWGDRLMLKGKGNPCDDKKVTEAMEQYLAWKKIHEKAIKLQVKVKKTSKPRRISPSGH
jgi:hypothetical protein